jgi:hypothetical protein
MIVTSSARRSNRRLRDAGRPRRRIFVSPKANSLPSDDLRTRRRTPACRQFRELRLGSRAAPQPCPSPSRRARAIRSVRSRAQLARDDDEPARRRRQRTDRRRRAAKYVARAEHPQHVGRDDAVQRQRRGARRAVAQGARFWTIGFVGRSRAA